MDEAAAPSHQAGSRGFIFDTSFPTQAPSPDSSGMPPHLHTHYHGLNRATIKPGLDACKLLAPPAGLPSCPHHHHPQSPDSATTRALSENNADYTHPLPKNTSQLLVSVARILRLPPKALLGSGRRSVPHSLPFAHCLHSTHARHLPGHGAPVPSCCPHAVSSAAVPSPSSTCQNPVYPLKPDLHVLLSLPPAVCTCAEAPIGPRLVGLCPSSVERGVPCGQEGQLGRVCVLSQPPAVSSAEHVLDTHGEGIAHDSGRSILQLCAELTLKALQVSLPTI